jgi:hypothetical protein
MGRYVARVIQQGISSSDPGQRGKLRAEGFHYKDFGAMATIGKSRAVVEIGRLRFGGFLAWCAWLALHITVLIGFRNRVSVLLSWIYSYFFYGRGSRLITGYSSEQMAELSSDTMKGGGASTDPSLQKTAAIQDVAVPQSSAIRATSAVAAVSQTSAIKG